MRFADVTIEHVGLETDRLLSTVAGLDDEGMRTASRCSDWSRGHVLSHLARNADALARVYTVAISGTPDTMYDSPEARDADIEAGAARTVAAQLADLRDSASRFTSVATDFAALPVAQREVRVERTPGARHVPAQKVLFMRLRELVFHHVDLDAGYAFDQVSPDVVEMFLADSLKRLAGDPAAPGLAIRTTEGDDVTVGSGATEVTGPRAAVLQWLAREDPTGVTFDGPVPTLPFGG